MVEPSTLSGNVERSIEVEAETLELLLFDWLSELIFRKDRDSEVFPTAAVEITGESPATLRARAQGGRVDPERTLRGVDPKAVTFHRFALEQAGNGWRARVVVDL